MFYLILIFAIVLFGLNKVSLRAKQAWQQAGLVVLALGAVYVYNIFLLKNCPGDCAIRIDLLVVASLLVAFVIAAISRGLRLVRAARKDTAPTQD
jgi:hypothetical protein